MNKENPQLVFRDPGFPLFEARNFKAKSGRDSGLKVSSEGGMPKITLGITGLHEILGRDYGIEEPYWEPSTTFEKKKPTRTLKSDVRDN